MDRTWMCCPWQPQPQGCKNKAEARPELPRHPSARGMGPSPERPLLSGRMALNNSGVHPTPHGTPVNKRPHFLQAPQSLSAQTEKKLFLRPNQHLSVIKGSPFTALSLQGRRTIRSQQKNFKQVTVNSRGTSREAVTSN